jgi:hypothetical protein
MKRKKSKTTKRRRAVRDLTTRTAGSSKGKGLGAGKVNVGDLSFTHYQH